LIVAFLLTFLLLGGPTIKELPPPSWWEFELAPRLFFQISCELVIHEHVAKRLVLSSSLTIKDEYFQLLDSVLLRLGLREDNPTRYLSPLSLIAVDIRFSPFPQRWRSSNLSQTAVVSRLLFPCTPPPGPENYRLAPPLPPVYVTTHSAFSIIPSDDLAFRCTVHFS